MYKLVVLASGQGTNLQAIMDACQNGVLNAKVSLVITNKEDCGALEKAKKGGIRCKAIPFDRKDMIRSQYDMNLADYINCFKYDMIVCAGWMHILSKFFLNLIFKPIINLHPALPGQFPGAHGIKDAFDAFKKGKITKTGMMVHHVVEEIDAGKVVDQFEFEIDKDETLETLENKVRYYEKFVLIHAIHKVIHEIEKENENKYKLIYQGKVRDVYDLGNNQLAFVQTDRQSAFDKHICTIPGKGVVLTESSAWWFEKTREIIDNHYLWKDGRTLICKKCEPFKIEVVVRGYMTGSTSTSIWTHYQRGERVYCGIQFPDGLVKNQKLTENVITPTTKGVRDEPLTEKEIIVEGIMTIEEWMYIKEKALELFNFGQKIADEKGLILVDTKYEFGKDVYGNIILIDEIHTCDSSRYWLKDTYEERFMLGQEPEKFDKDIIRDYIISKCDPYKDQLPDIPDELIRKVSYTYQKFYEFLTGES